MTTKRDRLRDACKGFICLFAVLGLCILGRTDVPPPEAPKATGQRLKLLGPHHDFRLNLFSAEKLDCMTKHKRYCLFYTSHDHAGDFPVTDELTIGEAVTKRIGGDWPPSRQLRLIRRNVVLQTDAATADVNIVPGGGSLLDLIVKAGDVIEIVGRK